MQGILRFVIPVVVLAALCARVQAQPVITDELYASHHPRLLFSTSEIPALRAKVTDGGADDQAYQFIRTLAHNVYPSLGMTDLLGLWYGDGAVQNLALAAHIETAPESTTVALGKAVVMHLVDNYEPDFDEAGSGMRLQIMAIGYDSFFAGATEQERGKVRDEMVRYVQKMIWNPGYRNFELQPYLGNHSAMVGGALGLAAIALQDETEAYVTTDAMAMADRIASNLLLWQFDAGGSYCEGVLYALWTLHNYIPYFEARKRFDGFDWAGNPRLRAVEEWLAYEMLPEGFARTHNLNDSVINNIPIARNAAYLSWAMHEWDSGLSAWLWQHAMGTYGVDLGSDADQASVVLWHKPVTPVQPGSVLPPSRLWAGRGLYVYRTGWPGGMSSDDVLFSFYSGKFEGGHAQEDQNQFALYGYGERFVIDHGAGAGLGQSEAHNMVLIDGKGQHNAGQAIGTDGRMASYLLGAAADYVVGDATSAYATYSEYNAPDHPYIGADWSWGYSGANPVQFALRRVLTVRGAGAPPYFLIMDDIRKDDAVHDYQWRLHTRITNQVDTSSNPVVVSGATGALDVHLLNPAPASLGVSVVDIVNGNDESDARVLRVDCSAVEPRFAFLLVPRYASSPGPVTAHTGYPWGWAQDVDWGNGVVDVIVRNDSGNPVTHDGIQSDALVTLVRRDNAAVSGYLIAEGSNLSVDGDALAAVANGTMTCELSGPTLFVDRYDADFRVRNRGITSVRYRDLELDFTVDGADIVHSSATAAPGQRAAPDLRATAFPNPFNPCTSVRIRGDALAHTHVVVYDVGGRRVRSLWDAPLGATERTLDWDGRNDAGGGVASGVYFLRVATPSSARTLKITLLK